MGREVDELNNVLDNNIVGVNLLPRNSNGWTINGITAEYNDGVISLNGTCTRYISRGNYIVLPFQLKAGTYYFSCYIENASGLDLFLQENGTILAGYPGEVFSIDHDAMIYIGANIYENNTFTNTKLFIQLESGNNKTDYYRPSELYGVSKEVIRARTDNDGNIYATLKERIDYEKQANTYITSSFVSNNILPIKYKQTVIRNLIVEYANGIIAANGISNGSGGRTIPASDTFVLDANTYFSDFSNEGDPLTVFISKLDGNVILTGSDGRNKMFTIDEPTEVYISISVDDKKEYNSRIKIFLSNIPLKYNDAGQIIEDTVSYDALQNTFSSKNILPFRQKVIHLNDTLSSKYSNGILTITGTTSKEVSRLNKLTDVFMLKAGTYVFWSIPSTNGMFVQDLSNNILLSSNGSEVIIDEDTYCYIGTVMPIGAYANSYKLILEEAPKSRVYSYPVSINAIDDMARESIEDTTENLTKKISFP